MRWLCILALLSGTIGCGNTTSSSSTTEDTETHSLSQAVSVVVPDTLEWDHPNLSHISLFSALYNMPLSDDGRMIMLNERRKVSWFQAKMMPYDAVVTTEREYWYNNELHWTQVWEQQYVLWLTYQPHAWPSKVCVKRFLTDAEYLAWRGPNH